MSRSLAPLLFFATAAAAAAWVLSRRPVAAPGASRSSSSGPRLADPPALAVPDEPVSIPLGHWRPAAVAPIAPLREEPTLRDQLSMAIGDAVVDVIAIAEDEFLVEEDAFGVEAVELAFGDLFSDCLWLTGLFGLIDSDFAFLGDQFSGHFGS